MSGLKFMFWITVDQTQILEQAMVAKKQGDHVTIRQNVKGAGNCVANLSNKASMHT